MVSNMLSPGIVLAPLIKTGRLVIQSYLPEAMGAEEHLFHALNTLNEVHPQHVVVDAISACKRMGSEQAAFEYLMRVLNACKERGITCFYLNQAIGPDIVAGDQRDRHFVHHRYRGRSLPTLDRWLDETPVGHHEIKRLEAF